MASPSSSSSSSRRSCVVLLPENVVCDILSRLPVVSLLRFKSVCKSWYDIIQSPYFNHLRRHHDNKNNCNLLIMNQQHKKFDEYGCGLRFCLLSCEDFEYSKEIHLPNLSGVYIPTLRMVSCDGLICLYFDWKRPGSTYYMDAFLWNPATKHFRPLPRPLLPVHKHRLQSSCVSIGFCFDAIANDYKLVMILIYNQASQVQVYSLSTNSWRTIDGVFPINCVTRISSDPKAPYKNGTYSWFGTSLPAFENQHPLYDHSILSFDFSTEKFGTVPLPDACSVKQDPHPQFAIFNGNIACINKETPFDDTATVDTSHIEIWVLNEYGVKESWTKLYTIGPFSCPFPRGILKNRFLMLGELYQLDVYDIFTGEIKNITAEEDQLCWFVDDCVQFATYKESLVSIKGQDGVLGGAASKDNYNWNYWLPKCIP